MQRSGRKLISLVLVVMLVLTSLTLVPTSVAAAEEQTFQFSDSRGWGTCYLYAWDSDGDYITNAWPGIVLESSGTNDFGETQYKIHVPAGAEGVILNNGNGDLTEDITDFDVTGYYTTGERNGEGHLLVVSWTDEPATEPETEEPTEPEEGHTFQYIDNQNWGACYLYAFNDDGDVGTGWPGISLESFGVNDSGEKLYEINVPAGATGIVLSNGNGDQTVNIVDFDVTGYYATGERDGEGHLLVVSWKDEPGDRGTFRVGNAVCLL